MTEQNDLQHGETAEREASIDGREPTVRSPLPEIRIKPGTGETPRVDETGTRRIGQKLADRYLLEELLGRGGMSVVYRARHELLNKTVAIKLLRDDIQVGRAALARFQREAMASASIGNPHIVDITDCGFTEGDDAFIVMELLEGCDLRQALRREGPLAPGRAVAIVRQILKGLEAAHERGIIHRDLKAENVFLCRREGGEFVKLLDFGISKISEQGQSEPEHLRTSTGMVMGTPQYMAPEQAHGERDVDHRVDIYAAGVILYEMLTGQLPFSGKSALDVMMKHVQEEPQPPRERRPDLEIPASLERVALKAMSKNREQRYATAPQMLEALPASNALPGGYSSTSWAAAPRRVRRWPFALVVLGLFALVAVLLHVAIPGEERNPLRPPQNATAIAVVAPPNALTSSPDAAPAPDAAAAPAPIATNPAPRATLRISAHPRSAQILLDGEAIGVGRAHHSVVAGKRPVVLTVRAPGFRDHRAQIVPDHDQRLDVRLKRRRDKLPDAQQPQGKTGPGTKGTKRPTDLRDNPYLQWGPAP